LALFVPLSRFTPRVGGGSAFFVRQHTMTHIIKSDRWLGYGALICAIAVIISVSNAKLPAGQAGLLPVIICICLGPLGFYLSMRGVFVGSWLSRVIAGLALIYFGWMALWIIYTLFFTPLTRT